jgi:WD40 repeat protein
MSLSPAGVLTGTPSQVGSFSISLIAQDSVGQNSSPQGFTLQVLPKGFVPTATLQTSRVGHTATLLADGKVLVAGGVNNTAFPTTAELYDPVSGKFTATTGSLTTIRFWATATLLKSGKVLLVGGKGANLEQATAELYDPSTQTFAATTGAMSTERAYHTATLLNDGTVLVTGGLNLAGDGAGNPVTTAEIYDPSTNSFTLTTGSMTVGRFFHTATLLSSGKVFIAGGLSAGVNLTSTEIYDPATKSFTSAGVMTVVRMGHTATLLPSGKVLLAGGGSGFGASATNTAELFDPTAGTFTATNAMTNPRSPHTATLLSSGQVLVAGGAGQFFVRGPSSSISAAELFDPTTGNFTETADMTALRESHTATLLQTGDVLIVGGSDGTIGYSTTTAVYDSAELYQ